MLSVHRLVQTVLRDAMAEEEETAWKERVLLLLQTVCPDVSKFEEWAFCEQWVLHALVSATWLEQAAAQTETAALVCNETGYYLHKRGRYTEAEALLVLALAIYEESEHPLTATSLNNLAGLYDAQGNYAEAEPLYLRALVIREQSLGSRHPDMAGSLNNLAGLYRAQGKYEQAEALLVRALAIYERGATVLA